MQVSKSLLLFNLSWNWGGSRKPLHNISTGSSKTTQYSVFTLCVLYVVHGPVVSDTKIQPDFAKPFAYLRISTIKNFQRNERPLSTTSSVLPSSRHGLLFIFIYLVNCLNTDGDDYVRFRDTNLFHSMTWNKEAFK